MGTINCFSAAAYAVGLIVTLVLAAVLTPPAWWRRPNLRALAILGGGAWGIGALLLSLTQGPALAAATAPPPPGAGATYRVVDDLNLRAAKGTAAARIGVVPAESIVTATGLRDGDWWQVSARVDGREVRGWSSSLWLRRADESGR